MLAKHLVLIQSHVPLAFSQSALSSVLVREKAGAASVNAITKVITARFFITAGSHRISCHVNLSQRCHEALRFYGGTASDWNFESVGEIEKPGTLWLTPTRATANQPSVGPPGQDYWLSLNRPGVCDVPKRKSRSVSDCAEVRRVACSGRAGRHGNCATSDVGAVDGNGDYGVTCGLR
jgi:hypothetical protein